MNNTATDSRSIRLPYRAPWDWQQFHEHFALRSLAGVECLSPRRYARSVRLGADSGWFSVTPLDDRAELELELHLPTRHAEALTARVRKMFDLDSDPAPIAGHLGEDAVLGPLLLQAPGLRLPTAFDPFEQAVRAIVGQQVTVKAAVTIVGRLVQRLGETLPGEAEGQPTRLFPTPEALAGADLAGIGMPGKRVETLQRFSAACASGALALHVDDGAEDLVKRLCALPGIGPWTAEYVALRAFGDPDAFPAADLGLLKSPVWGAEGITARELQRRAEAWRPWRAYAAVYLWHAYSQAGRTGG
ncbi:DNA-3-methyladenine glycosylase family protein [Pseudomonas sp. PDM22]|uniref:DNA-3-methyladenine glycosylase family protein n=1 Tax=Pseudomonas sp. PDM22 TaxID=2769287 RepID=UPI0009D9A83C|nr:DNA-3-methyladenine glycosylase [Pseudomonas sp. PDM22]MBD9516766.1 DNA-3-methyladenine glycosylase 2 family protein [Pseudomonas sp. PDM22]OQR27939.1 3-methyladenine DNA glycosylase 2 [Pseudomonas sp. T]